MLDICLYSSLLLQILRSFIVIAHDLHSSFKPIHFIYLTGLDAEIQKRMDVSQGSLKQTHVQRVWESQPIPLSLLPEKITFQTPNCTSYINCNKFRSKRKIVLITFFVGDQFCACLIFTKQNEMSAQLADRKLVLLQANHEKLANHESRK